METIMETLIRDHKVFRNIFQDVEEMIKSMNLEPKSSEEKFGLLKNIVIIAYKLSEFAGRTDKHRQIEEITVYRELESLGYKDEAAMLREQHVEIMKEIKNMNSIIEEYRKGMKPIEEIANSLVKIFHKIKPMYVKHMDDEEKFFSKYFKLKRKQLRSMSM